MNTANKSAGDCAAISSATPTGTTTGALAPVPKCVRRERNGAITIAALIDEYMLAYVGRDSTRAQRLRWWIAQLRISDRISTRSLASRLLSGSSSSSTRGS